jgi:hypothetical protein
MQVRMEINEVEERKEGQNRSGHKEGQKQQLSLSRKLVFL